MAMEERDVSEEREEVVEGTEQERIQNEEEVFVLTFIYSYSLLIVGDQDPLLSYTDNW